MQNGQKQDYGDFLVILSIIGVLFFYVIVRYFFYYYLYFWKGVTIPLFYILQHTPATILDLLFLWAPEGIEKISGNMLDVILKHNNDYFINNPVPYQKINYFVNLLFRPYLVVFFLYTAYVVISKKSFKRRFFPINNKKKPEKSLSAIDLLLIQESKIWPSVQIMINEHPEKIGSLDSGKWAMSKRPEHFVKDHKLADEFVDEYDNKYYLLNEERTFKVFNIQMGKVWNGFSNLTKAERHLFAIMAPKILRDTDTSKSINGRIAESYSTGKKAAFSFAARKKTKELEKFVDDTIKKYMNNDKIKTILNRHFYKKTVFAALLEAAREDGVLASSEFLWLKTVDRDLWYMLNNVGRRAAFAECAAPWSHFLYEKALDRKIANPMISSAIIALDQYLFDTSYNFKKIYQTEELSDK